MQKSKRHSNIERLVIADITLAEAVPAELVAKPISERLTYSYLSSSALSLQANTAYMNHAMIAIQASALIVTLPIIYYIESKLFDAVYEPMTKKLISKLRREKPAKNSESFK
ncbi:MAG: hypothetical protein QW814_02505 [Methanothrix sp.]